MCWNAPISGIAFLLGMITVYILWNRNLHNDRVYASLLFTYSFVQLGELGMWLSIRRPSPCDLTNTVLVYPWLNKLSTYFVLICLWLHAIGFTIGLTVVYNIPWYVLATVTGISLVGLAIWLLTYTVDYSLVRINNSPHLSWGINTSFYVVVCAMVFIMSITYIRPHVDWIILGLFYVITFLVSSLPYKGKATATLWCWISAVLAPIILVLPLSR